MKNVVSLVFLNHLILYLSFKNALGPLPCQKKKMKDQGKRNLTHNILGIESTRSFCIRYRNKFETNDWIFDYMVCQLQVMELDTWSFCWLFPILPVGYQPPLLTISLTKISTLREYWMAIENIHLTFNIRII